MKGKPMLNKDYRRWLLQTQMLESISKNSPAIFVTKDLCQTQVFEKISEIKLCKDFVGNCKLERVWHYNETKFSAPLHGEIINERKMGIR